MGIDTQSFVDSTKKKILIADDNDDIREMLTLILKMEGYEVLGASNGEEAVMVAQLEHPDLIFM
ncbi:MAG TPA: response regulator, partial [Blastocatellia bacterium]|nr:response regulator [Blastocatellia bacterium]